jgi:hypothetical protein
MSENEKTEKKSSKPHILRSEALRVLNEVQAATGDALVVETKSGWVKVSAAADPRTRIYIQDRDDVQQVHLTGLGAGEPGTVAPPRKNGRVEAWLDVEAEDAVATLKSLIERVAAVTAPVKSERPAKVAGETAPKTERAAKAGAVDDSERMKRLAKRAEELGVGEVIPAVQAEEPAAETAQAE